MKILIAGANGYIGSRLVPLLAKEHEVYAIIRKEGSLSVPSHLQSRVHWIQADLLKPESLEAIPSDIEAAYYLVHSMKTGRDFADLDIEAARNFQERLSQTNARQIIYLSGLSNELNLSPHLASRKRVGEILRQGKVPVTILMAGIIIGKGSASFQIICDIVEKLPVMIAPKWVNNLTQPIALSDVLDYLIKVLDHPFCKNGEFEIGGPDILSYKTLLLEYARIRGKKRLIISVPVLTPRLSSYWLYFITRASFPLACSLVDSLKNNSICKEHRIQELFPKDLLSIDDAIREAIS